MSFILKVLWYFPVPLGVCVRLPSGPPWRPEWHADANLLVFWRRAAAARRGNASADTCASWDNRTPFGSWLHAVMMAPKSVSQFDMGIWVQEGAWLSGPRWDDVHVHAVTLTEFISPMFLRPPQPRDTATVSYFDEAPRKPCGPAVAQMVCIDCNMQVFYVLWLCEVYWLFNLHGQAGVVEVESFFRLKESNAEKWREACWKNHGLHLSISLIGDDLKTLHLLLYSCFSSL